MYNVYVKIQTLSPEVQVRGFWLIAVSLQAMSMYAMLIAQTQSSK